MDAGTIMSGTRSFVTLIKHNTFYSQASASGD
jgi:hypothetical protein